jgi:hypothetical protein
MATMLSEGVNLRGAPTHPAHAAPLREHPLSGLDVASVSKNLTQEIETNEYIAVGQQVTE